MSAHTLVPYALVMLVRDDSILMLKRSMASKFAPGAYSLPGGRVEKNETFRHALVREIQEELGIVIREDDLEFVHTFYRKGTENELIACIFKCMQWQGEPFNKEPEKHEELCWIPFNHLPENIIPAHKKVWEYIQQGKMYSEHY